jgi:hypothetical protein
VWAEVDPDKFPQQIGSDLCGAGHQTADLLLRMPKGSATCPPLLWRPSCLCAGENDLVVVRSPKSGVNFFSLGNFTGQLEAARYRTHQELQNERFFS